MPGRPKGTYRIQMLNRSMQASAIGASARRRLRRRTQVDHRLYCSTNGCATVLSLDPESGLATCPICGLTRIIR
jgi:hypothetical protein